MICCIVRIAHINAICNVLLIEHSISKNFSFNSECYLLYCFILLYKLFHEPC